jgi:hypothetical protein
VKRLTSIGLLAVAIGPLAIGCGGKGSSAVQDAGATSRASATPADAHATAAYAHAVNLQPTDVHGLTAEGREAQAYRNERIVVPFRCDGGIVARDTTIYSARFVKYAPPSLGISLPRMTVLSDVYVAASADSAARDVAADRERRVQECVGRYPLTAGGARGPLVRPRVSISALALTAPPGGFAFSSTERGLYEPAQPSGEPSSRELARKRFHLRPRPFTTDYLGFASGRAEVTLLVFRTTDAAPLALERRLLALLLARARASAARFTQIDSSR